MPVKVLLLAAIAVFSAGCREKPASDIRVGSVLPKWEEGYLDIHGINTGRGECWYLILPDGTGLLVDASGSEPQDIRPQDPPVTPAKPSPEVENGAVISAYLRRFMPPVAGGKLDYFLVSHYHGDHFGFFSPIEEERTIHPDGKFIETSVSVVGEQFPMETVLDRGPFDRRASASYFGRDSRERYDNYIQYLRWAGKAHGTRRETFRVGADDQIVLKHRPEAYPEFSVRNIAAGGNVWTGTGVDSTWVPTAEECLGYGDSLKCRIHKGCPKINENIFSCVFVLNYGKFNYFSGGDLQYKRREVYPWYDMELPVSKVVPEVDVMKMNHHGTSGANGSDLVGALHPEVAVAGVWRDVQPNPETMKVFTTVNPSVGLIATNMTPENRDKLAAGGVPMENFLSMQGHVVIRVAPGGGSYRVMILDDGDMKYRVKAVFGPYQSK